MSPLRPARRSRCSSLSPDRSAQQLAIAGAAAEVGDGVLDVVDGFSENNPRAAMARIEGVEKRL
jgi:hypothetical protein